jgi:hypothetical protein
LQPDVSAGVGHFVDVPIQAVDGHRFTVLIKGDDIVNIFAEFVRGISAGGRPAHSEYRGAGGDIGDDQLDLCFMVSQVGKRNDIADPLCIACPQRASHQEEKKILFDAHINS